MKMIHKHIPMIIFMVLAAAFASPHTAGAKTVELDVTENTDIFEPLQEALDQAQGLDETLIVVIPEGEYTLSGCLGIYDNTELSMNGVTLHRTKEDAVMMHNASVSKPCPKYSGFKNITIRGGVWDGSYFSHCIFRFGHGKNLTLTGVTMENISDQHIMEFCAMDGVTIKNCKFLNFRHSGSKKKYMEALQIDETKETSMVKFEPYDQTPNKNVTVTGCLFKNLQCGLGNHSKITNVFHRNIRISNNRFVNIEKYAIRVFNYKNSKICNNTFSRTGTKIIVGCDISGKYSPVFPLLKNNSSHEKKHSWSKWMVKRYSTFTRKSRTCRKCGATQRQLIRGSKKKINKKAKNK